MVETKKLTVGIPTYNSSKYLVACIKSVINCKSVDEILVSDDKSSSVEYKKTLDIVEKFNKKSRVQISIFRNEKNRGAYENKFNLFNLAKNDYVYILDSDNIASKNLDTIFFEKILKESSSDFLFQPNKMYQFWTRPRLSKLLSFFQKKYVVKFVNKDTEIDLSMTKASLIFNPGGYNLNSYIEKNNIKVNELNKGKFIIDKWIFWVLNCGNFIAHKKYMLDIGKEGLKVDRNLRSVDAIVFSYLWLKSGRKIKIYNDFYHHHRKRNDSVSFTEKDDSSFAIKYYIQKVLSEG